MKISFLQIVFWLTCLALGVVIVGLIAANIVGALQGVEYVMNTPIGTVVKSSIPIWLAGAGILWIYGFVVLGRGWAARSTGRNLLLLFLLLFLSTVVSPYFYWKRETL